MTKPRPKDDLDAFAAAYATARTKDPVGLLDFFDPTGSYTDMAMGTTYEGAAARDDVTSMAHLREGPQPNSIPFHPCSGHRLIARGSSDSPTFSAGTEGTSA